jgi:hypothetical protein
MIEAAETSETLVNCQTIRHYNPEDSHQEMHGLYVVSMWKISEYKRLEDKNHFVRKQPAS